MASTQITTGKVRFSYVTLIAPKASTAGGKEKFSITLLIPKTDTATIEKIKAAVAAAKDVYLQKNPGKKLPADLKTTLHDGDGEKPNGGEYGPECRGCYVITASSINRPVLVDSAKNPILDPSEIYSGCYGRAVLNFYVYDTSGSKGISAGLNGVMFLTDGEPLSGSVVTDSDWDDGWTDSTAGLLD